MRLVRSRVRGSEAACPRTTGTGSPRRAAGRALRIARRLGGLNALAWALMAVPAFVRDWFYDWFARRRYRWFGKGSSAWCLRRR